MFLSPKARGNDSIYLLELLYENAYKTQFLAPSKSSTNATHMQTFFLYF